MKLITPRDNLMGENPPQFLRRAGYALLEDRRSGQTSFVRRLGGGFYPRLHLYFDETPDTITFNLHLDQKQASYEGITRHSGEYDSPLVQEEIARLKNILGV